MRGKETKTTPKALHEFLDHVAQIRPHHTAIEESANRTTITYRGLATLSDRLRDRLLHLGVRPGDRVGIYIRKSIDAVVSIFGILKSGGAYIPVDPSAPASRNAYILNDCSVKAVITEKRFEERLRADFGQSGEMPRLLSLEATGGGQPLREMLECAQKKTPAPTAETVIPSPNDLAYILYTSGSTGKPKGVVLSHRHAVSFIDWCSGVFEPNEEDRFSSHAPFHFDLSIPDIYVSIKHGATQRSGFVPGSTFL